MKYVLRNKETGDYLKKLGMWVHHFEDAMTFEDMVEVREFCQAHRINNVQASLRLMPYLLALLTPGSRSAIAGT